MTYVRHNCDPYAICHIVYFSIHWVEYDPSCHSYQKSEVIMIKLGSQNAKNPCYIVRIQIIVTKRVI